jgi:hypothetical protein
MLLKCSDRIQLPSILPSQGDILTLSQSLEITKLTVLTEAEKTRLAIKQDENGTNIYYSFPSQNDFETEIALTPSQVIFLKKYANDANVAQKVTIANLDLVTKIINA